MGTRADFYVGRGESAEWLGSVAMDGYPSGIPKAVKDAVSEADYRSAVAAFLAETDHATTPDLGWPWPWENSHTTDYAYAFDGAMYGSCFGHAWFPVNEEPEEHGDSKPTTFPDMSARQATTFGKRSGIIIIG